MRIVYCSRYNPDCIVCIPDSTCQKYIMTGGCIFATIVIYYDNLDDWNYSENDEYCYSITN